MWSTPVIETLDEAVNFYLDDCSALGFSPRSITSKRQTLERFTYWCSTVGTHNPKEVNVEVMEGFRQYLHHYRKVLDGEPLSINSKYKFLTDLKLFLRRLYRRKIISNADFEAFDMPKSQKRLPHAILSFEEVMRVFQLASMRGDRSGIRDRAILELFYATAIRRSEMARLEVEAIDLDSHKLWIFEGKGLKDRRLPIAERACEWIDIYYQEVRPRYKTLNSGDAVFLSSNGFPLDADQIGRLVGKYIRRAGIDKPGACHLLRHSVATSMLDADAGIRHVQELLGRADISTTQIYTHVAIKQLERVYNRTHPAATGRG